MASTITDGGINIPAMPPLKDRPQDSVPGVSEVLRAAREAGFLDVATPQMRVEATREIARTCAATAWLVAEFSEARDLLAGFPAKAIAEVNDSRVTIARAGDDARLDPASRGHSLRGSWHSVGGVEHAEWILLLGISDDSGRQVAALVRRDEVMRATYPYLGGLRGVGWENLVIDGLAIDSHRWIDTTALAGRGLGDDRLIGVALGCAEGGYSDYVGATRARMTGIGGQAVAHFTQVQARLAESDAELRSMASLFEHMKAGLDAHDAQRRRDRAYLARKSLDALTRLVRQMGAMGLAESNPVQRRYRDLRAITADAAFAWDANMAGFGRELLGIAEPAATDA